MKYRTFSTPASYDSPKAKLAGNNNTPVSTIIAVAAMLVITTACDSGSTSGNSVQNTTPEQTVYDSVSSSPADVMSDFVQRNAVGVPATTSPNTLINGNFENGTTGWTSCNSGGIRTATNAYDGNNALKVNGQNCFYQSVQATPGEEIVLSCYARVVDNNIWTGLGLGFSDASWQTISDTPASVVSGSSYARYDVRAVAPAGASYTTMWFYSETAALVDNCTLLPANEVPAPPITNSENLLDNGDFETVSNNFPNNWQQGCGGEAYTASQNGDADLIINDGACVVQSLSASDLGAMRGNLYELACDIDLTANYYASISLNIDGNETVEVVPPFTSDAVSLTVLAPQNATSGFVSMYSEAGPDSLRVRSCELSRVSVEPNEGGNPDNNLLVNGSFDEVDANNKPQGWTKGNSGSWESIDSPYSSAALELVGDGINSVMQELSSEAVAILSENQYTLNCDAWHFGDGYAVIDLVVNGSTIIRNSIDKTAYYQPITFSGEMSYLTSARMDIYTTGTLRIDNCILEAEDLTTRPTNVASIDTRVNIEGRDFYSVTGPYTFEIAITNNGDQLLTDVSYSTAALPCEGTAGNLQPDQTFTAQCASDVVVSRAGQTSVTAEVTALGTAPDGSQVSNTDTAGYTVGSLRPDPRGILAIKAKYRKIAPGDDAVFIVSAAPTGNASGLETITSDQAACAKTFSPVLGGGSFAVYECVIPNVQSNLTVEVEAIFGLGAYKAYGGDQASVVVE